MLRGGGAGWRPAQAGRLTRWERLAFALVFLLMVAYILAVTISAVRSHGGGTQPARQEKQSGATATSG